MDDRRELKDDLLRVGAELLTLPALAIDWGVQQLSHRVVRVLTRAVDDSVFEFYLARLNRVVNIELILRHLNIN